MSKKKAQKATANKKSGSDGKSVPHKTLKKVVQQVGKAESLGDVKKGKPIAKSEPQKEGKANTKKSRILPLILSEFARDTEAGARRDVKEIAQAVGFDACDVIKYCSVYEKAVYTAWKNLPKTGAIAEKIPTRIAKTRAKPKKGEPKIASVDNEEGTSEEN